MLERVLRCTTQSGYGQLCPAVVLEEEAGDEKVQYEPFVSYKAVREINEMLGDSEHKSTEHDNEHKDASDGAKQTAVLCESDRKYAEDEEESYAAAAADAVEPHMELMTDEYADHSKALLATESGEQKIGSNAAIMDEEEPVQLLCNTDDERKTADTTNAHSSGDAESEIKIDAESTCVLSDVSESNVHTDKHNVPVPDPETPPENFNDKAMTDEKEPEQVGSDTASMSASADSGSESKADGLSEPIAHETCSVEEFRLLINNQKESTHVNEPPHRADQGLDNPTSTQQLNELIGQFELCMISGSAASSLQNSDRVHTHKKSLEDAELHRVLNKLNRKH